MTYKIIRIDHKHANVGIGKRLHYLDIMSIARILKLLDKGVRGVAPRRHIVFKAEKHRFGMLKPGSIYNLDASATMSSLGKK